MYQTFNMGVGMEVIVKSSIDAYKVIQHANKYGIRSFMTGYTETSPDGINKVKIGSSIFTK